MKAEFKITYFLWKARKDKNGLMPLYVRSEQNNPKGVTHNTGVKLLLSQWNKKRKEPSNKAAKLIELEAKIKETYKDLVEQGYEPDLREILDKLNDPKRPAGLKIAAWCDDYCNGQYSEGQKKAVRTVKTNIESFHPGLTFDKLTKPRLKDFFEYLASHREADKKKETSEKKKSHEQPSGVANNSQYKRLRALVNVAHHADIEAPHLFNYKLPYETTNALKARLNWAEVKAIIEAEPLTSLEAVAKDVFLLACFSGLRISDILTLNRGELHGYHYERVQIKTKMPVMVTVHRYNEELFKKYINKGVPFTRQRLSDALKEVLKRSGLTKSVTKIQAVGYKPTETVKEKWEEIAFHSGRRFYSRLLNDLGLGGEVARDELGHGFKSITDLYAGSPEHSHRIARVRKAMESMEETLEQLALMKVA